MGTPTEKSFRITHKVTSGENKEVPVSNVVEILGTYTSSVLGNCAVGAISHVSGTITTTSEAKDFRGNALKKRAKLTLREVFSALDAHKGLLDTMKGANYTPSMVIITDNVQRGDKTSYDRPYTPAGLDDELPLTFCSYHLAQYLMTRPELGPCIRLPMMQNPAGGHRYETLVTIWVWYPQSVDMFLDLQIKKSGFPEKITHTQYPTLIERTKLFLDNEAKIEHEISNSQNKGHGRRLAAA